MTTLTKSYQVGDTFTSTKVLDGGSAKLTLLDGEQYIVKEVLSDFIVAEGYVHIKQEGRDTFAVVEFMYSE